MRKTIESVDITVPKVLLTGHVFERKPRIQGVKSTSAQINIPKRFGNKTYIVILIPKEDAGELRDTIQL